MKAPKITRDLVLFIGGFAGILNEAFFRSGTERPYLLVVFSGMAGLPVFLRHDEKADKSSGPSIKEMSLQDLVEKIEKLKK